MIGQSSLFQSNPKITNFWHMGPIVILWHLFFFYLLWLQRLTGGAHLSGRNKRNVRPRRAAEPGARTRAAEGTGEGGELALIAK